MSSKIEQICTPPARSGYNLPNNGWKIMRAQPRKQHLINTAFKLFNEHGYHATGIDWILKESGVSKATLYKHFSSKEALILAVLQQRHEQLLESMAEHLAQAQTTDETPILALFDALDTWFHSETFFGCNFIKASAEYAQVDNAIHDYSAEHKDSMRHLFLPYISSESEALKTKFSEQLMLLVEGAIVAAHVHNNKNSAQTAKAMATILLENLLPKLIPVNQ